MPLSPMTSFLAYYFRQDYLLENIEEKAERKKLELLIDSPNSYKSKVEFPSFTSLQKCVCGSLKQKFGKEVFLNPKC